MLGRRKLAVAFGGARPDAGHTAPPGAGRTARVEWRTTPATKTRAQELADLHQEREQKALVKLVALATQDIGRKGRSYSEDEALTLLRAGFPTAVPAALPLPAARHWLWAIGLFTVARNLPWPPFNGLAPG